MLINAQKHPQWRSVLLCLFTKESRAVSTNQVEPTIVFGDYEVEF
jgi:hypothetical protein